jgi:PAS domain S-box-containing protein
MTSGGRATPTGNIEGLHASSSVVELIAEFGRQVSHLSFREVARGALGFMDRRLNIGRVSIALLLEDPARFRMFDSTTVVEGVESGKVIPFNSASLGATVTAAAAVYRPDIRQWSTPNPVDAALLEAGLLSSYSVPLLCGGRCMGTLNAAAHTVDGISPEMRQVMDLVAPQLAFAIHVGVTHDELAQSETRFRDVFETVGDGIVVADVGNRKLVMVNSAICALLGRPSHELLGLTVDDIHPADRLSEVMATFVAMLEGELDHALEVPMVRGDGTEILADVTARHTTLSGRRCVVGVFRDATVRRNREQEQVQLQKLESISTLAAGIAHDFNNLLTSLIGNVSLAQLQIAEGSDTGQLLAEAQRAAVRATALTRQLLTFAKGGAPVQKVADIVQIVRESAPLASSGSNVHCQFDLPSQRLFAMGDEGQLAQVMQNLVRNAVEAMPNGGVVRIKVALLQGHKGKEIGIEVNDGGPGIAKENLGRIFEPFFTTKPHGTGLGLAVAHSIVQKHAGRMGVSSNVGAGATFQVFLPFLEERNPETIRVQSAARGAGRVLIMDDEAAILQVAERALRATGYDTCVVGNGMDAITAYGHALTQGQRFDAVILDLTVLGGMGGREAAAAILALDPSARIIVSSGYSNDSTMAAFRTLGFRALLPKPYSITQLCSAVEQLLQ